MWKELTSAEGGFTIQMIDGAKMSKEKTPTALGDVELVTWLGENEGKVYYVAFVDYPKGALKNAEGALDGARDGAVKAVKGTIVSEKRIKVAGHPARDLAVSAQAEGTTLALRVRLIMAANRLYTLQVVVPGGSLAVAETEATRFFDSLRLKGGEGGRKKHR